MSHAQRDGYCLWIRSKSCVWADVKHRSVWTQAEGGTVNTAVRYWRGVYTTEQKWHGSDKNWNGSNSFCKETVKFYPFRVGSTGAYGPVTERIKLHCFFAKTIGTVPVFVGSVPFLLCRVNAPWKGKNKNWHGSNLSMSPTASQYNLNNERFVTSQSGIDSCLFELSSGSKWQLSWFYSFADLWKVKVKCRDVWFINGVEIR